jgi:putative colanic acid biosynthesis UDP-glucose lipid carrier transferase
MSTLAAHYQPLGTELPLVALVRILLVPVMCALCLAATLLVYGEPFDDRYATLAGVAMLVSIWAFGELPLANGRARLSFFAPSRAIVASWLKVVGVLLFIAFATKLTSMYSRKVVLTWFFVAPFALQVAQEIARLMLHRLLASQAAGRVKVLVGVNDTARELARRIREDPCMGVIAGYFDDRRGERVAGIRPQEVIGGLGDVVDRVRRHRIDVVYITLPMTRDPRITRMIDGLRDTTASIYFVPCTLPFEPIQARVDYIGGVPVIAVCETPFCGMNGVLKRAFDLVCAGLALAAAWPVMLALAIGVKRSSPGPVLFRQKRYGLDGRQIRVWKFRTMRVCEDGERIEQAKRDDGRVTPFGAFLRRNSLDELPQLFNVLGGSMSLVGPRPHAVAHNEHYRGLIRGYMLRHKVKPGITGWAQVNGYRGETETVEKMQKRVEHDLDYLRHWSISLDIWILLRTAWVLLDRRNAY